MAGQPQTGPPGHTGRSPSGRNQAGGLRSRSGEVCLTQTILLHYSQGDRFLFSSHTLFYRVNFRLLKWPLLGSSWVISGGSPPLPTVRQAHVSALPRHPA